MNVFLAGTDNYEASRILGSLEYPYRLCSYLYLSQESKRQEILEHAKDGSEWIMDSGLFTFMFGSGKDQNKLTTYQDYKDYATKYVDTALDWGWEHTIVECDIQRVLGPDETLRLREEVFDRCGLPVLYVWHVPETEDGLRALAANREYIALSIPELRMVLSGPGATQGGKKVRQALIHLIRIIRQSGTPRVHLLGCTEPSLMTLPADTCDSTSWKAGTIWGRPTVWDGSRIRQIWLRSPKWLAWREYAERTFPDAAAEIRAWIEAEDREAEKEATRIDYCLNDMASACSFWYQMEAING